MGSDKRDDAERMRALLDCTRQPTRRELVVLILRLSTPAVLAELANIIMGYIDSAMVGSLGARATASIGLVASSTWLVFGMCASFAVGYYVQIAQAIGAGRDRDARDILRRSIGAMLLLGLVVAAMCALAAPHLPRWLGGEQELWADSSAYFLILGLMIPAEQMIRLFTGALQASGDMRTPSLLNVLMCVLDVAFNLLLIYPTRTVSVAGAQFTLWGAGWGVAGAGAGTAAAELVVAVLLGWACCVRSSILRLAGRGASDRAGRSAGRGVHAGALKVSLPLALERVALSLAQVVTTALIAPLGSVALAAHSLAITAEGLCYMPGFGVASAATTLVGQSVGAGRTDLARRLGRLATGLGMALMTGAAALLFILAPLVMATLTPDEAVRSLGATVLRIEMLAEPMFGAAIVASGAMRGAGDSLVPSLFSLGCMWVLRVPAVALLAPQVGLIGVWCAMCAELVVRGSLQLVRLRGCRWLTRGAGAGVRAAERGAQE